MTFPPLSELIPLLQVAVGPVILISGVGLLLLSMTNRLGRAIDRARVLHRELPPPESAEYRRTVTQLQVLWRRADRLRRSIILASLSLLLAACLIVTLFVAAWLGLDAGGAIVVLFTGCLAALIGALLLFIRDVNESLAALRLDLQDIVDETDHG